MFEMFSIEHYAALFVGVVIFVAIIVYRKQLRGPKLNGKFRWFMAVLLLGCEVTLQATYIVGGSWGAESLPFELCSITLLLSAIVLAFRVKKLYAIVFFLGSLGALQALITPSLDQAFPQFRYFHFFIAHIGIIATALFLLVVEQYRPTIRSVFSALLWIHVLAIPAAIVNIVTGTTNFMFLARKPASASLLDALAPWPWYLLQMELLAIAMCLVLLGITELIHKMTRRK
ncbi:TIGR02206 family membrane protein [Paenibacillus sp. GSMTC-2017]|uniref:YwaF family protein n=1 Tax=Paenibacillus sp. GSMTC-2017 TaxID=2794350 RepID=UPI0018D9BE33|nr:TIGR02206 family membrane protein [Paenibacillus sp. GSMTC-2017]MBH5316937.1 TIGR02206 family membrane protein [Paenibacillus sp. GSMTC-2017]